MLQFLIYSFAWPTILFCKAVRFFIWHILSAGNWKGQQEQPNLVEIWQGQALVEQRFHRDLELVSRRQREELEDRYRKVLKQKEREIQSLRSF